MNEIMRQELEALREQHVLLLGKWDELQAIARKIADAQDGLRQQLAAVNGKLSFWELKADIEALSAKHEAGELAPGELRALQAKQADFSRREAKRYGDG